MNREKLKKHPHETTSGGSVKKQDDETRASNKQKSERQNADNKLSTEIKTHLINHEEIDTSGVQVDVSDGEVVLQGEVDNAHAKSLTCNITTQEVTGTKHVKSDKLNYKRDNNEAP